MYTGITENDLGSTFERVLGYFPIYPEKDKLIDALFMSKYTVCQIIIFHFQFTYSRNTDMVSKTDIGQNDQKKMVPKDNADVWTL